MKRKSKKNLSLWDKSKLKLAAVKDWLVSIKDWAIDKCMDCVTSHAFWTNVVLILFGVSLLCPIVTWQTALGWAMVSLGLLRIHEDHSSHW